MRMRKNDKNVLYVQYVCEEILRQLDRWIKFSCPAPVFYLRRNRKRTHELSYWSDIFLFADLRYKMTAAAMAIVTSA